MPTKYTDALAVLGDDLEAKSIVDKLERELQLTGIQRSEVAKLIERSIQDAGDVELVQKADVTTVNSDMMHIIPDAEMPAWRKLLRKLSDEGKIEISDTDDLANQLNKMLDWISSFLEEKSLVEKTAQREDVSVADKKQAEKEYGDVKYADEKNKKYPIDTEAHIRAAWNYINKEKNAAKYSVEDVNKIKARIVAAWKDKIDKEGPPSAKKSMTDEQPELEEKCMDDEMTMWKPLGGATSLAEAESYIRAYELEEAFYQLYSQFGAVASNIMAGDNPVEDKLGQMTALLEEFKQKLSPETLVELSQVTKKSDDETKGDVTDMDNSVVKSLSDEVAKLAVVVEEIKQRVYSADTPVVKSETETPASNAQFHPVVAEFNQTFTDAIAKSGAERRDALQQVLNQLGEQFVQLTQTDVQKSEAGSNLEAVVSQVVEAQINPVKTDIANIASQLGSLATLVQQSLIGKATVKPQNPLIINTPPVQKSVVTPVNPMPLTPSQRGQGMSIMEIARKTTFGR